MEIAAGPGDWKCESNSTTIVIPAWVAKLTWESFEEAGRVQEITFEAGSQLRELDMCILHTCPWLESICIPASVEVIRFCSPADDNCLVEDSAVERITFEEGSQLREIQKASFSGCYSLESICLPASVQSMEGSSFRWSSLSEVSVESGNRFFRASGPFLLDFAGVRIVRYFGSENTITIPSEIETLGDSCFSFCSMRTVRFESMSKLSVIESRAFEWCGYLQSITIPASVTILGEFCFDSCPLLRVVSIEHDSQLIRAGDRPFAHTELKSIVLPSSLEIIGEYCFFNCRALESVIFPKDSKLVRIERMAFGHCFSLTSLSLSPLLEFVGEHCFVDSSSFSTLTFSSPSRLRELLDLPPLWTGCNQIPDFVEVLHLCRSDLHPDPCTLTFGDESRLREVRTSGEIVGLFRPPGPQFRYVVGATSRSLKLIRSNLEFDGSGCDEFRANC
jgi:hypothetical protein